MPKLTRTVPRYKGDDQPVTAFTDAGLEALEPKLRSAIREHQPEIDRIYNRHDHLRDIGTCVLGAGVGVYYVPKRHRYAKTRRVYTPPFQGSVTIEQISRKIIASLKLRGVDAFFLWGRMD